MAHRSPPPFLEPQLAQLVKAAPEGDGWVHEIKLDGYRILARKDGDAVTLLSRTARDWTAQFPPVARAIAGLGADSAILDTEVAIVLADGKTSFQALQNAIGAPGSGQLACFAFDLLYLDGEDLRELPLTERKARLRALIDQTTGKATGVIRYSDHVEGRGRDVFAAACQQGLEGIISKRRDAPYRAGRGPAWVKTKCVLRQELVVAGYTDPDGSRTGLGAILVGVYQGRDLVYAGKVGTGFSQKSLTELSRALAALETRTCPFAVTPPRAWTGGGVHWVKPQLVAEVEFTEWTGDGRLRHPSFQGLRKDKKAKDVVREIAVAVGRADAPAPRARARATATAKTKARPKATAKKT
jgi:bifunctional non-homologous end joining protein LigD